MLEIVGKVIADIAHDCELRNRDIPNTQQHMSITFDQFYVKNWVSGLFYPVLNWKRKSACRSGMCFILYK